MVVSTGKTGKKKGPKTRVIVEDDSDDEGKSAGFNEQSSVYQIHKILTSEQYTLGRNVS
jgi:hypothetical protein